MTNIQGIVNPHGKKTLTPTAILEGRKRLVSHFGGKIAGKPQASWTMDEKIAQSIYHSLTETLYKIAPDTKDLDKIYRLYERNEVDGIGGLIIKHAVKTFWIILIISILLALLKYISIDFLLLS